MGTTTSYVPYDYRRTCDLCGGLYNISKMHKQGPYTYCLEHAGERINEQLDRANARQRPFRILPVPNAKPEDQDQPNVYETEESVIYTLLDQAIGGGARYLNVIAGTPTAIPNAEDVIPTNAWAVQHLYGLALATYPKGHVNVWPAQALLRIRTYADTLLARQNLTGTRATNSYYGGFLATGGSFYFSENASTAGLACLYAFRLLGDIKYIAAARAAASFLRNMQSIGTCGVNFPSSDVAGTARLYTGGIVNSVSSSAGFISDCFFYPSSLLALQFWNELKLTDGDQSLGATATIAGDFSTAPAKLLSACMTDLRVLWETGTYNPPTLDVRTGLSATTPSERFSAFPRGTGTWEYQDGGAALGTTISSLNFAKALSALYAVDGLSSQVQAIDDWLQTFASNTAYETPAATSQRTLARTTTGVYAASQAPAQFLLVRDATNSYAATAKNAGSLYDWGAFGLMAPLWSTRRSLAFKLARGAASQPRRRLSDGTPEDGIWVDRGFLRGRQGLTYQTAFTEVIAHGPDAISLPADAVATPSTDNMVFWFKADAGVTMDASNRVSTWADQTANHYDVSPLDPSGNPLATGRWPVYTPNVLPSGLPGLDWGTPGSYPTPGRSLTHETNTANVPLAGGAARTILALVKPNWAYGGRILCIRRSPKATVYCMNSTFTNPFNGWPMYAHDYTGSLVLGGNYLPIGPGTPAAASTVDYTNTPVVIAWLQDALGNITVYINGVLRETMEYFNFDNSGINSSGPPGLYPVVAEDGAKGFSIGSEEIDGAVIPWNGWMTELIMYGAADVGLVSHNTNYLLNRAGSLATGMVYDAVAAAQFGLSLRYAPRS